jgi:4-hydroxythreonine-4-phosphate dehydrogenase
VLAVLRGDARAVVTNPISKSVLQAGGFAHPGHTEFLGALAEAHFGIAQAKPVMLLASAELKVVPLTVHIPLSRVASEISIEAIVETASILNLTLARDFGIARPRIAVAGLNPHAGEQGTIGLEDTEIIAPAIAALVSLGLDVTGPHSADTLFHAAARETYDAVLAMYHDQALIPIKTLAFDSGVNVTIGLPFVRTSPDHGTAFSIAGTGRARPLSLIEALRLADTLSRRRAGVLPERA